MYRSQEKEVQADTESRAEDGQTLMERQMGTPRTQTEKDRQTHRETANQMRQVDRGVQRTQASPGQVDTLRWSRKW